ncbi:hypothetical protein HDU67_005284 [Dinochytrium kinnereticum]|nr:hypothetical protein HDU67_005284 [Dinochytrium kinnereticum]
MVLDDKLHLHSAGPKFGNFKTVKVDAIITVGILTFDDECYLQRHSDSVFLCRKAEKARIINYSLHVSEKDVVVIYGFHEDSNNKVDAVAVGRKGTLISFFEGCPFSEIKRSEYSKIYKKYSLQAILPDTIVVPSPDSKKRKHVDPTVKLVYPSKGRDAVTIHEEDLDRLKEGEFLNDTIIEYLTLFLCADKVEEFYIFSTFFFHQLCTKDDSGLHWYLAVIVNPGALLDSTTS